MKLCLIGTGLMGLPMARRLLDAGFNLTVFNRTTSKAQPLVAQGARLASSASEAVKDADIIITMLENGQVQQQLLVEQQLLQALKPGSLLIDMASIPPELAKNHAQLASQAGIDYLDAPVSGGTLGAEQGSLSIMAGGSQAAFDRAQPVFTVLGKASTYIGPAGSGQLAKCANQAIVGITIGAVSEALLLAAAGGANPEAVREALLGGFASSRILELHGQRMLDGNFQPGATARVQLKDMRTILDTARQSDLTLPLAESTYQQYRELVQKGFEELDHSGLLVQLEALNAPVKLRTEA